jgi:predicted ATPase
MALVQAALGEFEQARERIRELIVCGQSVENPYAFVFSRVTAAVPCAVLRDFEATLTHSEDGLRLAEEHGFNNFKAILTATAGWARGMLDPSTEASNEVLAGINSVMAGGNWFQPLFASLLAEIQFGSGRSADALATVDRAKSEIKDHANQFHSLLLCAKAGVLLALDTPDRAEAERTCLTAIDIARAQRAKLWELRAVMRLARLWHADGKTAQDRDLLGPLYGSFTEGFETADLKEARALLDALV